MVGDCGPHSHTARGTLVEGSRHVKGFVIILYRLMEEPFVMEIQRKDRLVTPTVVQVCVSQLFRQEIFDKGFLSMH